MKNTKQRKLILDIINNSCDHLDAYSIYNESKKQITNISLGTVYRNLNDLVLNKKIIKIQVNGISYFDKSVPHDHFICNECFKIIDIDCIKIPVINNFNGNKVTDYKIVLNGICKECLERK